MGSGFSETAYRIFEIAGMLVSLACCISIASAKPSKNQQNLLLMCIFGLVATVGNTMEVFANAPEAAMVAIRIAYIGKCYIITFGLMFVSSYSGVKLNAFFLRFLALANSVVLVTVMTCEYHHLYYKDISYEILSNGRAAMILTPGPFYYVWVGLLLLGAGNYIVIAVREMRGVTPIAKRRTRILLLAVAAPMVASISFLVVHPTYFDPATLIVMMSELCFLVAIKRYGLLDTLELAHERIIEDTRDGILVVDGRKHTILHQNAAAKSLIEKAMEKDADFRIERFIASDESVYELDGRHYEFRVSEIIQGESETEAQGYVVWIFDMTFIDEYASEMIRLRDEADEANRAKTEFLANISHEIRTPMNSIVGCSELALQCRDDDAVTNYLRKIKKSSAVLMHLIDELIDVTKIESGRVKLHKENYRMTELMDEVRHTFEPQAGKARLSFGVKIDSGLPEYLYGDKEKLREILSQLIGNSIQHTKKGGVIVEITLKDVSERGMLINIKVDDTGIGIDESEGDRVFGKFERIERDDSAYSYGPGLGLSIVKSFVEMMGGEISYESESGQGTRFSVDVWQEIGSGQDADAETEEPYLAATYDESKPVDDDVGEAPAKEDSGITPRRINSGKVLIVDDNDLNLEVASGIMELMGMVTKTAASGTECIELLDKGEKPDIIFMDHMMPDPDGVATMKLIRARDDGLADIPIVLLTANAVSGVKEQMIEAGFDDFLPKPIEIDELSRILARFLGERM